jgi:hypothetical protein
VEGGLRRIRVRGGGGKRQTSNENSNDGEVGGYSVEALEPMFAKSGLRRHCSREREDRHEW